MRLLPVILVLSLLAAGWAERIEIDTGGDPNSRLEIRNVVLPGGESAELYVIEGSRVRVTIGERELIAEHLEVDLERRVVRVIGFGTFVTPEQTVQGDDLVIELEQESLTGDDVLIVTEAIDVIGDEAIRAPGQIDVVRGRFSPCSRCDQEVEDFGFHAERIELYPGDRLVAFDVTVLIRERSTLTLPLMVVPLARPERQPRLSVSQGSASERAEVALDWPYVSGANAFGTFSLRYYADIGPSAGNGPDLLGGPIATGYLGGAVDHVFYTDRGQGDFDFSYRPGFLGEEGEPRERSQFRVRLAYQTLDEAPLDGSGRPSLDLSVSRDDQLRDRLLEYRLEMAGLESGVLATFSSQGFADTDPRDAVKEPSYDDRATPRRTPVRLVLEPEEERFAVGPLFLRRLALDLGAFEDASNPSNRSAAVQEFIDAGRLLERHSIELRPLPLWSGMELSGHSNFVGHYYTTGERLIDWDSRASATQRFGETGSFGLVFTRDVSEGETPFRFDQIPLRTRTDLRGVLRLQPLPWLAVEAEDTYVFRDSRRPELEGFQPFQSRLRLFDNLAWIEAGVANSYDIQAGDPGELEFELSLRNPDPSPRAQLEVRHLHDLAVRPSRLTGEPIDETETNFALEYGLRYLRLDASGGYRYYPPNDDEQASPERWLPFEAGLSLGTLEQDDLVPGLRVAYTRNMNRRRVEALSYQAATRLGPLELTANQRYDLPEGGTASSTLRARYPGVAELEAAGFALLRPEWLGLPAGEARLERYAVTVQDAPLEGREAWQLRYLTRYDPELEEVGGFRDSALEARVLLEDEQWGATRFGIDFFADLQLRDDRLESSYLRRASLELAADIEGKVGIQGAFGYRGTMSSTPGELARAELRLDDVAVTVRARHDLYLGALFNDVWDLTGRNPALPAFDPRPELFLVWDRCCWALMGGWNTRTGQLRLLLTTPGADQGVSQAIETPLVLPGRGGAR